MTIVVDQKISKNNLRCVTLEWEKPNTYVVEAIQRYAADDPYAYLIRKSRIYAMSELDKAKACFKRYCKRYLEE